MKRLTNFYNKTNGFWRITRIILIILFIFPLFKVLGNNNVLYAFLNASCGIYVILMILILLNRTSDKYRKKLRKWTGFLSLLYGITMSIFLIKLEFELDLIVTSYFQIIPLWIILFGIWELDSVKTGRK
jgi:hypothetical protein